MGSVKGWELEALAPDARLDLRGTNDSLTYAKVCLQLEPMEIGQILELLVGDGRSLHCLPIDRRDDGHRLLKVEAMSDGTGYRIWMEKGTGWAANAEGIDGDGTGAASINTDRSRRADQYHWVSPGGDRARGVWPL